MFDEEPTDDDLVSWLEEEGALVWDGMDENGERTFRTNPDKMREIFPELYEAMMEEVSESLNMLYDMGLVDVGLDENGEYYVISEEGKKLMQKYGFNTGEQND